jgi:hypothetical protein
MRCTIVVGWSLQFIDNMGGRGSTVVPSATLGLGVVWIVAALAASTVFVLVVGPVVSLARKLAHQA